ncbi:MAG: hypothetical protein ACREEM_29380 [Blastocatellia bacterium]
MINFNMICSSLSSDGVCAWAGTKAAMAIKKRRERNRKENPADLNKNIHLSPFHPQIERTIPCPAPGKLIWDANEWNCRRWVSRPLFRVGRTDTTTQVYGWAILGSNGKDKFEATIKELQVGED